MIFGTSKILFEKKLSLRLPRDTYREIVLTYEYRKINYVPVTNLLV